MKNFFKQFFDIKFWKFILVGIINTIVGLGANLICLNVFKFSVPVCGAVDVIVGSIVSYFLNKYFTFKKKEKSGMTLLLFALNIAVCYVLFKWLLVEYIAIPALNSLFPSWNTELINSIATVIGAGFFMIFNYIGQRFFVFREKKEDDKSEPMVKE